MFAIVKISGKQYRVSPTDVIEVDNLNAKEGEKLVFDEVYMVSDDKKTLVGTPVVKGYTVQAIVKSNFKGDKVEVRRYKHKVRYRKHIGFRARLTSLEIQSISKS